MMLVITTRFSLELFSLFIMCVHMCLYVINCLCVYFITISGFWLKNDILVTLDSGVFWSFGEQG